MPIPNKRVSEDVNKFIQRCMTDEEMKKEFPNEKQRFAVCVNKLTK